MIAFLLRAEYSHIQPGGKEAPDQLCQPCHGWEAPYVSSVLNPCQPTACQAAIPHMWGLILIIAWVSRGMRHSQHHMGKLLSFVSHQTAKGSANREIVGMVVRPNDLDILIWTSEVVDMPPESLLMSLNGHHLFPASRNLLATLVEMHWKSYNCNCIACCIQYLQYWRIDRLI